MRIIQSRTLARAFGGVTFVLALLVLLGFLASSSVARCAQLGDFLYEGDTNEVLVTGYLGTGRLLEIPTVINGVPVTGIADYAFSHQPTVREVVFPATLTSIGRGAFFWCTNLRTIQLPAGLRSVQPWTFFWCTALTNVDLGDGVLEIGREAFSTCTQLQTVRFGEGLASIGANAFYGCGLLGEARLGKGVFQIGPRAFAGCVGMTNLVLGDGVVSDVDSTAFSGCAGLAAVSLGAGFHAIDQLELRACPRLVSVSVDPRNPFYSSVDGVLYDKSGVELLRYPRGRLGAYRVPDGITAIAPHAAEGCTGLTGLSFGPNGCAIGVGAFEECANLVSLSLPETASILTMQEGAFAGCVRLSSLGFGTGLVAIPPRAFRGCSSIGSLVLPDGIKTIGAGAFAGCGGVTNLSLPQGMVSIGDDAFALCFRLPSVSVPDSVTLLGDGAFRDCDGLREARLGAGLKAIPHSLFSYCWQLQTIRLPSAVTDVGAYAFYGCTGLSSVTFGTGVSSLGDGAFYGCAGIRAAYFEGNAPTDAGGDVFLTAGDVIVYRQAAATGWGPMFGGRPVAIRGAGLVYGDWAVSSGLVGRFPNASRALDDPDGDGLSNFAEMNAGTDPLRVDSVLAFTMRSRVEDLSMEDRGPIAAGQIPLYFNSVPGRHYRLLRAETLGNVGWRDVGVAFTAMTALKRVVLDNDGASGFFRLVVDP